MCYYLIVCMLEKPPAVCRRTVGYPCVGVFTSTEVRALSIKKEEESKGSSASRTTQETCDTKPEQGLRMIRALDAPSLLAAVPPRPQDGTAFFSHRTLYTLHPSVQLGNGLRKVRCRKPALLQLVSKNTGPY